MFRSLDQDYNFVWDLEIEEFTISGLHYILSGFPYVYRDVCDHFRYMWE